MPIDVKPASPSRTALANLTLRDYFAGQALVGVMVMRAAIRDQGYDDINQESIAEEAYELADAMLAERSK